MDLSVFNKSINLMLRMADTRTETQPMREPDSDKPRYVRKEAEKTLLRVQPESVGMSSAHIANYFEALDKARDLDMHSVMLIKDGKVIAEADYGAYDKTLWHSMFSQSKTITGIAVLSLVEEGKLNLEDRVIKLLDEQVPFRASLSSEMRDLTVEDLLTMRSGVGFNEMGATVETDWVRHYFTSYSWNKPGEHFSYNSLNSYILASIVREITGHNVSEYLYPRMFRPMGIERIYWERCPMGTEKGGWGLYMLIEDMAKIGVLLANGGMWGEERILAQSLVERLCEMKVETPPIVGDYNYGRHAWVGRSENRYLINGMFGQNIIIWPEHKLVLAATGGNGDLFQFSSFFDITHEYFDGGNGMATPDDEAAAANLSARLSALSLRGREPEAIPQMCHDLAGRSYKVDSKCSPSLGLMPVMMQMSQNKFAKGIAGLSFHMHESKLCMDVEGVEDTVHRLPLGFGTPEYTELSFSNDIHKVAVLARLAQDEEARDVLIIRLSFLEMASARVIKLRFEGGYDEISVESDETPGTKFAFGLLRRWMGMLKLPALLGSSIEDWRELDYVELFMRASMEQRFTVRQDGTC